MAGRFIKLPGFFDTLLLRIPSKKTWCSIYFEEPSEVVLREEQDATVLHQPPPYSIIAEVKTGHHI